MADSVVVPSLTDDERTDNNARIESLSELIRSGKAVLFAGSGTSIQAGFPEWEQLVKKLEQVALGCGPGLVVDAGVYDKDPVELLRYVDRLKKHISDKMGNPNRYYSFLVEEFGQQPRLLDFHHDLVRLPFRGIVTTNYDVTLEVALAKIDVERGFESCVIAGLNPPDPVAVHTFLRSLSDDQPQRRVLHLHGCHRARSSMILAESEYREGYEHQQTVTEEGPVTKVKLLIQVVHTLLITHPLVFVGFGLRDPYLMPLLGLVTNTFQLEGLTNHFAIFGIGSNDAIRMKERAQLFKNKYGVDVVFYERTDGADPEAGLVELVGRIGLDVSPVAQTDWLEEQNATMQSRITR